MTGGTGGKTDMERVGLFSEMGYTTIGDKYSQVHPSSMPFHTDAYKGKHILPGGTKTKSGLQAGYFDKHFNRIMEKEAYTDTVKLKRQERLQETKKNLSKAFMPNAASKLPSGLGNHYGTFSGPVSAFSPVARPRKPYAAPGRNFTTNPSKKGTGYGYVNVTLGKQQEHAVDSFDKAKELRKKEMLTHKSMLRSGAFRLNMHPQEFFDKNPYHSDRTVGPSKKGSSMLSPVKPFKPSSPGKMIGGAKAGTFDPYPTHSNDPYTTKRRREVTTNKDGKLFHPSAGPKSSPTKSIVAQNIIKSVHGGNYKTARNVMAF